MENIYICRVGFIYTKYYIEVKLLAPNKIEAKNKFILKLLEKYSIILKVIDFQQFYDPLENSVKPLDFSNILVFTHFLI